jgi:TM2 domain-containing membrane protein YozV
MSYKNPGVAAVLSFLISGLGQIYNGEIKKGLWHVSVAMVGLLLVLIGALILGTSLYYGIFFFKFMLASIVLLATGGMMICWIGIISIYDAYKNAS